MRKKKIIILIIALIIASVIIALIINQVINTKGGSNIDVQKEIVNEINNTSEIQETFENVNVIENTNEIQEESISIVEDTKEELNLSEENKVQEDENIQEQKNVTKNTQEKVTKSPKQAEIKETAQTTEEITTKNENKEEKQEQTVQENKIENIVQEKPKCSDTKHGIVAGNSNKWFDSYEEADSFYNAEIEVWGKQWENGEIDKDEYLEKCPAGFEVWTCPICQKWTLNFYYR